MITDNQNNNNNNNNHYHLDWYKMQSYDGTGGPSTSTTINHKAVVAGTATDHQQQQQRTVFPRPATPWLLDGMPWNLATTTAPQPGGVMQFGSHANATANPNFNFETESQCGKFQQKRKALEEQVSFLPPKQFITEERITAHFSGLQISADTNGVQVGVGNNNTVSGVHGGLASDDIPSTSTGKTHHHPNPAFQIAAMELEQKLRNANRIVLCDEFKQTATIGPQTGGCVLPPELLMKTIPRPCTALIPWQPPQPPLVKMFGSQEQPQPPPASQRTTTTTDSILEDYDDENNNSCGDEHMDEDLDL